MILKVLLFKRGELHSPPPCCDQRYPLLHTPVFCGQLGQSWVPQSSASVTTWTKKLGITKAFQSQRIQVKDCGGLLKKPGEASVSLKGTRGCTAGGLLHLSCVGNGG